MQPGLGGGYFVLTLHGGCFDELVYHTTLQSAETAWRAFYELGDDVDYDSHDPESDHDCLILYGDFIDVVEGDPEQDEEQFVTKVKELAHRLSIYQRRRTREAQAKIQSLLEDIGRFTDAFPDDDEGSAS